MAAEVPCAEDISRATRWLQGLAAENPIELVRLWKAAIEEEEGGAAAIGQSGSADSESPAGDGEVLEWEPKKQVAMPVNDRKHSEELAPALPQLKREPPEPPRGRAQGLGAAIAHGSHSDSDEVKYDKNEDFDDGKVKSEVALGTRGAVGPGPLPTAQVVKPEPEVKAEAAAGVVVAAVGAFGVEKPSREVAVPDGRGKRKQEASGESDTPRGAWEAEGHTGAVKRPRDEAADNRLPPMKADSSVRAAHSQAGGDDGPAKAPKGAGVGIKEEATSRVQAARAPGGVRTITPAKGGKAPVVPKEVARVQAAVSPVRKKEAQAGSGAKGAGVAEAVAGRAGGDVGAVDEPDTKTKVLEVVPGIEHAPFEFKRGECMDNGPIEVGKKMALKFKVEHMGTHVAKFFRGKITRVYARGSQNWRKGFNVEVKWDEEGREDLLLSSRARAHSLDEERAYCIGGWILIS